MKNNCNKFNELITSYIDDELDVRRRKQVQSHLEACSECNDHYLGELNVKKLLKSQLPEIKAPVQLRHRIRRQLARKGSRPGFWQLIQSLFVYRPIAASAALAAIAFFALFPRFEIRNKISPLLDSHSEQIAEVQDLKGKIVCLDCEFLSRNIKSVAHDNLTHRPGLKTDNNSIWTFLHTTNIQELLHNQEFLNKNAVVSGILFENSRYIQVNDYKLL